MECTHVTAPASIGGTGDLSRSRKKRSTKEGPRPGRPPRGERRGEEKRRKRESRKGNARDKEPNRTDKKSNHQISRNHRRTNAKTDKKTKHRMTAKFFGGRFCQTRPIKKNSGQKGKNRNSGYRRKQPDRKQGAPKQPKIERSKNFSAP